MWPFDNVLKRKKMMELEEEKRRRDQRNIDMISRQNEIAINYRSGRRTGDDDMVCSIMPLILLDSQNYSCDPSPSCDTSYSSPSCDTGSSYDSGSSSSFDSGGSCGSDN